MKKMAKIKVNIWGENEDIEKIYIRIDLFNKIPAFPIKEIIDLAEAKLRPELLPLATSFPIKIELEIKDNGLLPQKHS